MTIHPSNNEMLLSHTDMQKHDSNIANIAATKTYIIALNSICRCINHQCMHHNACTLYY
jgi:hypothetical protein